MRKIVLLFFGILTVTSVSLCQTEAFTKDGKRVLLFNDGSWKYASRFETETEKGSSDYECSYQLNKVNEATGRRVVSLEPVIVGQTSNGAPLWFSLRRVENFYGMYLEAGGVDLGCLGKYKSILTIKFQDGAVYDFSQISQVPCDGNLRMFCMLAPGEIRGSSNAALQERQQEIIERFRTIPVESFRIRGEEAFDDVELNQVGKSYFLSSLGCME